MVDNVHAGICQMGIIERIKGIKTVGIDFRRAISTQEFPAEVDTDLRHYGRSVLMIGGSYFNGSDEILFSIGA